MGKSDEFSLVCQGKMAIGWLPVVLIPVPKSIEIDKRSDKKFRQGFIVTQAAERGTENQKKLLSLDTRGRGSARRLSEVRVGAGQWVWPECALHGLSTHFGGADSRDRG